MPIHQKMARGMSRLGWQVSSARVVMASKPRKLKTASEVAPASAPRLLNSKGFMLHSVASPT